MNEIKYKFSWDMIGDVEIGRPKLGPEAHVHVYRLMQFCLGEALFNIVDFDKAKEIYLKTGLKAAFAYYNKYCDDATTFEDKIERVRNALSKDKICILSIDVVEDKGYVFTVSESVGFRNTPVDESYSYDYIEGFITGLVQQIMGSKYEITKEIPSEESGNNYIFYTTELN